jgi:hypothetical protein
VDVARWRGVAPGGGWQGLGGGWQGLGGEWQGLGGGVLVARPVGRTMRLQCEELVNEHVALQPHLHGNE